MTPRSTSAKLALLGALYLSQGLPYGFFTQALPVMMRQSGRSLAQIGLASLLAVPWALKFLWAPWVDRHGWSNFGRRKSWIVPLQLSSAAVLAGAGWLEPTSGFTPLFAVVLLVNALSATQDIATDALAVEMLAPAERGLANGLQVGGYRLGMVLGGGALLIFFTHVGWRLSFAMMGCAIIVATIPVWIHHEVPRHVSDAPPRQTGAPHFWRLTKAASLLAMLFLFKLGEALATAMLRPFMADRGMGLEEVGWLLGTVGFVAGLAGALVGGWLAGRLPRKTVLVVGAAAQAATVASYVWVAVAVPNRSALGLVVAAEHFGGGMATAGLFTCMMDWCRPGLSGSDYTVQASTVVVATGLAAGLSGYSAHLLGYAGHFGLAFLLSLVALVATIALFPSTAPTERAGQEKLTCA